MEPIFRGNPHSPEDVKFFFLHVSVALSLTLTLQSLAKLLRGIQGQATPETFILIVILPNSAGPIRNAVKHWGDVKVGVMSQCLQLEKFMSANNQYWKNVALK